MTEGDRRDRRVAWALLRRLARAERTALVASTAAALAWLGFGIAVPVVLGWTVQRGIVESDLSAVWLGAGLIVLVGAGEAASDALRHTAEMRAYERTRARLRNAVADAAFGLDEPARDRWPSGQLTARATIDADGVAGAAESIGYTVAYLVSIPVVIRLLLRIDAVIAAVVIATVVVNVLVTWRVSAAWERRIEVGQAALGDTIAAAQAALEGFKVIAGVGGQDGIHRAYAARSAIGRDRAVATARLWLPFGPALAAIGGVPTLAVVWIGGVRAIDGHADIGSVVAATGLALFLRTPVESAGGSIVAVRSAIASARRLVDVVEPDGVGPQPAAGGADPTRRAAGGDLIVDGVAFRYPGDPGRFALGEVSLRAGPGDVVLIDGPVGAGKSTLAALVAGDRVPLTGRVLLGGVDVAALNDDERHRAVLRLGPEPFLLAGTIAANVRLGAPEAGDSDVADALAAAGASEFVDRLAGGADTVLADRGASLSGGQRQRIALARAMLARPDVLVLDGATSGLEPEREATVLESVARRWRHGVVVLASTHAAARRLADVVVELPAPRWQSLGRGP